MAKLDPQHRYDLPAVFGPSPFPDVTSMGAVQTISVPFKTSSSAARDLLPRHFEPTDDPIVTVAHTRNRDVDYMGGRGYNIVRVGVTAMFRGETETIVAPYAPVIWESDAAPITLGRERGGYAKIFGSIPDSVDTEDGSTFECREYETLLLGAEVTGWQPIKGEELTSLQQAASSAASLGWKYIPGIGPEPDADYPVHLVGHYHYDAAWRGRGTVAFERPGATAAPYSSHVLAVLAELPVLGYEPAVMVRGSMKLPRTGVCRLS
jgi:acetoacetate decarboxylase